jgi:hypothetical protein
MLLLPLQMCALLEPVALCSPSAFTSMQGCRAVSGETYSVEKVERGIAMELAPTSQRPGRTLAPMEALQRELRAQARPLTAAPSWRQTPCALRRPGWVCPSCRLNHCGVGPWLD